MESLKSKIFIKLFHHNNTAWNAQYLSDTGIKIYPADLYRGRQISKADITYQQHDRIQTESQHATVDNCFDLVGPLSTV